MFNLGQQIIIMASKKVSKKYFEFIFFHENAIWTSLESVKTYLMIKNMYETPCWESNYSKQIISDVEPSLIPWTFRHFSLASFHSHFFILLFSHPTRNTKIRIFFQSKPTNNHNITNFLTHSTQTWWIEAGWRRETIETLSILLFFRFFDKWSEFSIEHDCFFYQNLQKFSSIGNIHQTTMSELCMRFPRYFSTSTQSSKILATYKFSKKHKNFEWTFHISNFCDEDWSEFSLACWYDKFESHSKTLFRCSMAEYREYRVQALNEWGIMWLLKCLGNFSNLVVEWEVLRHATSSTSEYFSLIKDYTRQIQWEEMKILNSTSMTLS